MTEEEAKTKWCPLLAIGRPLLDEHHHCAGAACMMWEWWPRVARHKVKGTFHDVVVLTHPNATEYEAMPLGGGCGLLRCDR